MRSRREGTATLRALARSLEGQRNHDSIERSDAPMRNDSDARPWIDAVDALARRQRRVMLLAVSTWVILALAQVVGTWWLWSQGWTVILPRPQLVLPWEDTFAGSGCIRWKIEGLRSMLLAWAVVAVLPLVVVPPRRAKRVAAKDLAAPGAGPYRTPVVPEARVARSLGMISLPSARRVLVAAAGGSYVLITAHWQAVILRFPFHAEVNGVALLDVLFAVAVVLTYLIAALGSTKPRD